ncbi:unnamed protein product [Meloidogyne enterolobii]|uniref:Uncharacterized protein n=3 Tax=Meloidogyne enterolobii TaxID=390850 RepID=A0A6V7XLV9_MELEN|nr:unnamed protein product [Meloidogyne enterolobii]
MFLLRVIVELYLSLAESNIEVRRVHHDKPVDYKNGGERIIDGINKWFEEFGGLNKEGYEVFENKIKNNIKIVLYNERGIFKYMDSADTWADQNQTRKIFKITTRTIFFSPRDIPDLCRPVALPERIYK